MKNTINHGNNDRSLSINYGKSRNTNSMISNEVTSNTNLSICWNPKYISKNTSLQYNQNKRELNSSNQLQPYDPALPEFVDNVPFLQPKQSLYSRRTFHNENSEFNKAFIVDEDFTNRFDSFKRRKSSIVIPPIRVPAPEPNAIDPDLFNPVAPRTNYNTEQNVQISFEQTNLGQFPKLQTHKLLNKTKTLPLPSSNTTNLNVHTITRNDQINTLMHPEDCNTKGFHQSLKNMYHNELMIRRQSMIAAMPSSCDPLNNNLALLLKSSKQHKRYNRNRNFDRISRRSSNVSASCIPLTNKLQQLSLRHGCISPSIKKNLVIPTMHKVNNKIDLNPQVTVNPASRRELFNSETISPLKASTVHILTTFSICSPDFQFTTMSNPKCILTKPAKPELNNSNDNIDGNYILSVSDILGLESNRKYLVLDMLGQGTFGQVVKCQTMGTGELVAVKVIKSRTDYFNQSMFELRHLNLIIQKLNLQDKKRFLEIKDSFIHKSHLCLVFELLDKSLYELLKENKFHGLPIKIVRDFVKQLLRSMVILKELGFVHCDLKPENILLCSDKTTEIKIIDYGSSCKEAQILYGYIQSRFYRAPEVILGMPYTSSIDMWSLGCIAAELLLGIPIFPGSSEYNQLSRIITMLGNPANWMLDIGKASTKYFNKQTLNSFNKTSETNNVTVVYSFKSIDQYNLENNVLETPSKQYFKETQLPDIIRNCRLPTNIEDPQVIQTEYEERESFIDFLKGILNINPIERWTPQQASLHPFVVQKAFNGEWYPPGFIPRTEHYI